MGYILVGQHGLIRRRTYNGRAYSRGLRYGTNAGWVKYSKNSYKYLWGGKSARRYN